jgi:hypothetical protein
VKTFRVRLTVSAGLLLCACGSLVFEEEAQGEPSPRLIASPSGETGGQSDLPPAAGGDMGLGGTSTHGSCPNAAAGIGCCDPAQKAATSSPSAYVLEIANDASPERVLRIYVTLADPIDQAEVVGLLGERGATDIASLAATKEVGADLKARYLSEVLCWASVVSIRSERSYWCIIAKPEPWSVDGLGRKQCPLASDGVCYEHCVGVSGKPIDPQQACFGPLELVTCSTSEIEPPAAGGCRVKISTGQIYDFEKEAPSDPDFVGWRECTNSELVLRASALSTPCP